MCDCAAHERKNQPLSLWNRYIAGFYTGSTSVTGAQDQGYLAIFELSQIVMGNNAAHKKCIAVKISNSSKIYSEVKVKVGEKYNMPVKYRHRVGA